ncbi:MAG: phosphate starvation-inducible PhoH-like protein [Candidatus Krumholzibacteriia bacterium]|jgi:phosphate starvation-inducible PhoH-like protein
MSVDRKNHKDESSGEIKLALRGIEQLKLFGAGDVNLRNLENRFGGTITARGDVLFILGPSNKINMVSEICAELIDRVEQGQLIDEVALGYLWDQHNGQGDGAADHQVERETLLFSGGSRTAVRCKTAGQQAYIDAIRKHDVVFGIGPAGTGKTFLAVVMAMDYLKRNLVDRIVLVRPAVEAGEQLGFLPGDLQEKINPYMRPLHDALADIGGTDKVARMMASGVIEASPLAYMRGRTLNNAFVILDEAQNTTVGQMKMFLTRLGFQSKAVVTGDITQIDLPSNQESGLVHVRQILAETDGVAFADLDGRDVVRHPLVRRIVEAFEAAGVTSK